MEKAKLVTNSPYPSEEIAARYGYEIHKDVLPCEFKGGDLEVVGILEEGEDKIDDETMRFRARSLGGYLGLIDAEYVLEHQAEIPAEFREGECYFIFPGTHLYVDGGDVRRTTLVFWDKEEKRWSMGTQWMCSWWDKKARLIRRKEG